MSMEPLTCHEQENGGPYPHFARVLRNTYDGKIQLSVSEQGLMSPVAKIEMTRSEAKRFFFAAWAALQDEDD